MAKPKFSIPSVFEGWLVMAYEGMGLYGSLTIHDRYYLLNGLLKPYYGKRVRITVEEIDDSEEENSNG